MQPCHWSPSCSWYRTGDHSEPILEVNHRTGWATAVTPCSNLHQELNLAQQLWNWGSGNWNKDTGQGQETWGSPEPAGLLPSLSADQSGMSPTCQQVLGPGLRYSMGLTKPRRNFFSIPKGETHYARNMGTKLGLPSKNWSPQAWPSFFSKYLS
jgi:hypothetical protein